MYKYHRHCELKSSSAWNRMTTSSFGANQNKCRAGAFYVRIEGGRLYCLQQYLQMIHRPYIWYLQFVCVTHTAKQHHNHQGKVGHQLQRLILSACTAAYRMSNTELHWTHTLILCDAICKWKHLRWVNWICDYIWEEYMLA